MKHCGSWDIVPAVFNDKSPTFSKRVTTFLEAIHPYLKAKFIDANAAKWTMKMLDSAGARFKHFPMALYAVDVTFQVTNADVDGYELNRYDNGLFSAGEKRKTRRAGSAAKYREKRKQRLSALVPFGVEPEYDSMGSAEESSIFD
ncbi:hypothetical protein DYB32_005464 [Aphanomyces invadans]|uniref:Uncharacterized protein n=1 Tax=Aphanomyces invadans TaxID=157072 RepID=A0A3R6VKW6_9STRA|nr:hypothetical protein DYB32_005464 [Aphanomyces invadans]